MKVKKIETRWLPVGSLLLAGVLFLIVNISHAGNTQWWITSMGQTTEGDYIFESKSKSNYLSLGLMGRGERWALSVNVPYLYQKNGSYTQVNEVVVPGEDMEQNDHGGMHGGNNNQDPIPDEIILVEETIKPNPEYGLSDIYLFGNFKMIGKTRTPSGIFLNTQVKIPVANFEKGLGSGEYDYGLSLSFKKSLNTFNIFSDIGYLVLGDTEEFEFINPLTWGVGVGKSMNNGKFYTLLYYKQYTKIIKDYESPRQLSVGINYRISPRMFLSVGLIKGFSNTSPNRGLTGGVQIKI